MIELFNPISRQLEPLLDDQADKARPVTIYVCGITPYDTTHLGHAFTYTTADVLIRYLEYTGREVLYVQNVTDIDDDILRKAKELKGSWREIGDRWTTHFIEDMIALNVRAPEHYPRATEVIPEIVDTVSALIDRGVAYEKNGSVYYHVDSFAAFGALSCMDRETMLATANERGNRPDDPNKRDPLDFVLWQAAAPGEPTWESPWGPGRPGWHIECSTMSTKFLGETIDVHSGGGDLLFPHHCCEIAQIEPITGKTFVRFWIHAAMVRHEGEKMSKSLGNLVWARELLKTYSANAIRLYLASHHYEIEWSHDAGLLDWAALVAERISRAASCESGKAKAFDASEGVEKFKLAMESNLNTPKAIGILDDLSVEILLAAAGGADVRAAQVDLKAMGRVFGMMLDRGEDKDGVTALWKEHLKKFKPQ